MNVFYKKLLISVFTFFFSTRFNPDHILIKLNLFNLKEDWAKMSLNSPD